MTLYWPEEEKDVDLTAPRLHALVIGVGDYPHLIGGAGHPSVSSFGGLQQLTTTVLTAKRIAGWLAGEYSNPAVPLGSIEMLLSPSGPVDRPDGTQVTVDGASMADIRGVPGGAAGAFDRFFDRCNANKGNIAFFYFAGHGISSASQFLLASDFGDPARKNLWENCIDFDGLRVGMRGNAADTQLFFVDACREKPIDALTQLNPNGNPLCSADLFARIPDASAYYAAADGNQAYGPDDGVTYFASALLEALEGAGALQKNGKWVVDTFLLGSGLGHAMSAIGTEKKKQLSCNPNAGGKPIPIHFPAAPRVRASVGCSDEQANQEVEIELQQPGAAPLKSKKGEAPWKGRLALGRCDIKMTFDSRPDIAVIEKVTPPAFDYTEQV